MLNKCITVSALHSNLASTSEKCCYEGKRFKLVLVSSFLSLLLYSSSHHSNNNIKISFFTKSPLNSAGWKTQLQRRAAPRRATQFPLNNKSRLKSRCSLASPVHWHYLRQVHWVHTNGATPSLPLQRSLSSLANLELTFAYIFNLCSIPSLHQTQWTAMDAQYTSVGNLWQLWI